MGCRDESLWESGVCPVGSFYSRLYPLCDKSTVRCSIHRPYTAKSARSQCYTFTASQPLGPGACISPVLVMIRPKPWCTSA